MGFLRDNISDIAGPRGARGVNEIADARICAVNYAVKSDRGKDMIKRYMVRLKSTLRHRVDSMTP